MDMSALGINSMEDLLTYFLGPVETLSDAELEIRVRVLSKKLLPLKILVPIFLVVAFAGFFFGVIGLGFLQGFLLAVLFLLVSGALFVRMYSLRMEVKRLLGHNAVRAALDKAFELSEYSPVRFIEWEQIRAAELIDRNWNSCSGSDFVQGKYRNVSFTLSDIRLMRHRHDADGSQSKKTVFKGQWLIVDINRNLTDSLCIRERKARKRGVKSDLETENAIFNGRFQVVATDPHAASDIVTPHFMDYIVNRDAKAKTRVLMKFMGHRVHIALDSKRDLFEASEKKILSGMTVAQFREQIGQEVRYITEMIDELLLNEYLFR